MSSHRQARTKVAVVGLGYIGLPTAIVVASAGFDVLGYDVDENRVKMINEGTAPIMEPGLDEKLKAAVASGKLKASTTLEPADIVLVAVPTPFKHGKKADLTALFDAGTNIARTLKQDSLIIIESTVPVGTTERFAQLLEDISGCENNEDFFLAHCPERVLPGKIFEELVNNDRIVGGLGKEAGQRAHDFYATFVEGAVRVTDHVSAEMIKLVENSSRDVQIAFANEVAEMCFEAGIDPFQVIEHANRHPRVSILQPGCGVGGHCIAVDPWFLVESFPNASLLIRTARTINDTKPHLVMQRVCDALQELREEHPKNSRFTVLLLGASFKPNVDDLRESPSLFIAQELQKKGEFFDTLLCEPHGDAAALASLGAPPLVDLWAGIERADVIVPLVKHAVFETLTPADLRGKKILDVCGLFYDSAGETVAMKRAGHAASIEVQ